MFFSTAREEINDILSMIVILPHEGRLADSKTQADSAAPSLLVESTRASLPFSGKTIVLTGKLSLITRDRAVAAISSLGGKVSNSVTSTTDLLVVGAESANRATTKLIKAEKLGVELWDESKFMDTLRSFAYEFEK